MYFHFLAGLCIATRVHSAALNTETKTSQLESGERSASCNEILPLVGYTVARSFCASRRQLNEVKNNTTITLPGGILGVTPTQTPSRPTTLSSVNSNVPLAPLDTLDGADPLHIERVCSCVAQATVVIERRHAQITTRVSTKPVWTGPAMAITTSTLRAIPSVSSSGLVLGSTGPQALSASSSSFLLKSSSNTFSTVSTSFAVAIITRQVPMSAVTSSIGDLTTTSMSTSPSTTTTTSTTSTSATLIPIVQPAVSQPRVSTPNCDSTSSTNTDILLNGLCKCKVSTYCNRRTTSPSHASFPVPLLSTIVDTFDICLTLLDNEPLATFVTFDTATAVCSLFDDTVIDLVSDVSDAAKTVISAVRAQVCGNAICRVLSSLQLDGLVELVGNEVDEVEDVVQDITSNLLGSLG